MLNGFARALRRIFMPFPPYAAPDGFTWVLELDGRWTLSVSDPDIADVIANINHGGSAKKRKIAA